MIDVVSALNELSRIRPVFHSECDFQHALAWQLHAMFRDAKVRLEYRPFKGVRLDIWLLTLEGPVAIELKYLARRLSVEVDGELFRLTNQAAQDLRRYDFVKDIVWVERVVEEVPHATGYAILLTNDSSYWTASSRDGRIDAAIRLHEGRELSGTLQWAEHAAVGTVAGREEPLVLRDTHQIHWQDFSCVSSSTAGQFRYVVVRAALQPIEGQVPASMSRERRTA